MSSHLYAANSTRLTFGLHIPAQLLDCKTVQGAALLGLDPKHACLARVCPQSEGSQSVLWLDTPDLHPLSTLRQEIDKGYMFP